MGPNQALSLVDLHPEILKSIIDILKVRETLFLPRYGVPVPTDHNNANALPTDHSSENTPLLEVQSKEYYGEQSDDDDACIMGLMNWSMTCKYFHRMIVPDLYKTIVVRTKLKNLQSIQVLSKTSHWSMVSNLIFAGVWFEDDDWDGLTTERVEQMQPEMEALKSVMSNLPPNLDSLTLDFPRIWGVGTGYENLHENNLYGPDDEEELQEIEAGDIFRAQHTAVFTAIGSDVNIASVTGKSSFEFRLHNLGPMNNTAYSSPLFRNFLKHVTKFKLGLCCGDINEDAQANYFDVPQYFGERLSDFFFGHLDRCTRLTIHAEDTWPLGPGPARFLVKLPLPETTDHLPLVTHVDLKNCLMNPTLFAFLTSHLSTLTSIILTDCSALGNCFWAEHTNAPNWTDFFRRLSTATNPPPSQLTHVVVNYSSTTFEEQLEEKDWLPDTTKEQCKQIRGILDRQHSQAIQGNEMSEEDVARRRKTLYNYILVDDKYGFIHPDTEKNFERFLAGDDHDEWLNLVEVMERNAQRMRSLRAVQWKGGP